MAASPLPGEDLVITGLEDLRHRVRSTSALLVSIGAPRLRQLGYVIEAPFSTPEHQLYALLAEENAEAAHRRYNALVRRLVSFERAAACVR